MALLKNILSSLQNKAKQGVRSSRNFFTKKLNDDEGLFQKGRITFGAPANKFIRKNIVQPAQTIGKAPAYVGESAVRYPARGASELTLSLARMFDNKIPNETRVDQNTRAGRIFGEESLKPVQYQPETRTSRKLTSFLPEDIQYPAAVALSTIGAAADVIPDPINEKQAAKGVTKLAGQASRAVKRTDDIDDLMKSLRFTTKTGGEFDIKGTPLDSLFKKIPEVGTQLPAPQQVLSLKDVKKLANQGDNLQNVTVTVKNAEEAREAAKLGIDPARIEIPKTKTQGKKTFFSGDRGTSSKLEDVQTKNGFNDSPYKPTNSGIPKGKGQKIIDEYIRSSKSVIEKSGPSGKKVRELLEVAEEEGSLLAGNQINNLRKKIEGLSTQEKATFADVVEGKMIPISAKQVEAIETWKAISQDIYQQAQEAGLDIGFIEDYFPHHAITDTDPQTIRRMLGRQGQRRYGNLEFERQTDLPYDKDPSVLLDYIDSAYKRITEARYFGPDDRILYNLTNDIAKEGGDSAQAVKMLDQILGKNQNETMEQLSGNIRGFQSITKLGLASPLTNLTQNISTLLRTDPQSMGEAISLVLRNPDEALSNAIRVGEVSPDMARVFEQYAGQGNAVSKWLNLTGFIGAEKLNRILAVNAGMAYVKKLQDQAQTGSQAAIRELARLGFTADNLDTLKAGRRVSLETQFATQAGELPYAWSTPLGKIISQFKSFSYKQTGFIKNQAKRISEETLRGNFAPLANALLTYGVAAPVTGEVINNIRSLIFNREREDTDSLTERYISNILTASSFGLLDSTSGLFGQYGPQGVISTIGGPTVSDVTKLADTALNIGSEEEYQRNRSLRNIVKSVPAVGPALSNTFIPNSYVDNKDFFGTNLGVNEGLGGKDRELYDIMKGQDREEAEAFKTRKQQEREEKNKSEGGNFLTNIFGGKKEETLTGIPDGATTAEIKEFNSTFDRMVDEGLPVTEDAVRDRYFRKYTADADDISDREKAYAELKKIMDNEDLPDELKQQALSASGATQEDWEFYSLAKGNVRERREELVKMVGQITDREKLIPALFELRKSVAGSSALPTTDIDYLYDQGLITKEEKKYLSAVKYDELTGEFYMDRDYEGGGGGLSDSKKKALDKAVQKSLQAFIDQLNKQTTGNSGAIYDLIRALSKQSADTDRPYEAINKRLASIKLPVIKDKRV